MFRVISYFLAIAIFTTPWFIGGNWPFSRSILVGAGAAGLFAIFATLMRGFADKKAEGFVFPIVWLLLFAGLLFTAFQASNTSSWLQEQVGAPNPAISIHQTVDDTSEQLVKTKTVSAHRPISVYPAATREKLVDLILAVGVFLIATVVLNRRERLMLVIVALAASGVAISFVGILQRLSNNGKVLWQYELLGGGSPFGPFVNANNAAGFLLIGFSAAMFFCLPKTDPVEIRQHPRTTFTRRDWLGIKRSTKHFLWLDRSGRSNGISASLLFGSSDNYCRRSMCFSFARWHGGTGLFRNARLFLNYQEQSAGGNYINVGNSRWRNWAR